MNPLPKFLPKIHPNPFSHDHIFFLNNPTQPKENLAPNNQYQYQPQPQHLHHSTNYFRNPRFDPIFKVMCCTVLCR